MVQKILENKLKVAIYSGVSPAPHFIENLIDALSAEGLEIYIFGKKSSVSKKYNSNAHYILTPRNRVFKLVFLLKMVAISFFKNPIKLSKLIIYYKTLSSSLNKGKINWWTKVLPVVNNLPDIFHIQWAKSIEDWMFLKELFNIKIVLSLRGAHINYSPLANSNLAKSYKELFPQVDSFHAVSNSIALETKKYLEVDKDIKVIRTAVDIDLLNSYKKKKYNTNKNFEFISVGRHHWKKGYQYSLTALRNLIKDGYRANYTIIAKDEPSEEILYLTDNFNLMDHVCFISCHHQEQVYENMSKSDCLLLPSVEEGIANVVVEAMCIGLPVICSDLDGMKELVIHQNNAFLFKRRSSNDLMLQMKKIINYGEENRMRIIDNARIAIKKKHNLGRLAVEMKKLYLDI